jgi:competence protein ComEA
MFTRKVSLAGLVARTALVFTVSAACQSAFAQPDEGAARKPAEVEQVNINEADAATIADVLQGVGQSRAQAIVEYRDENGSFDSLDELSEVKGIGDATVNLNRDRIVLE